MQHLYPVDEKHGSYGQEAEEYWTIEGGNLCENSIRMENGLAPRTGHMSASPGEKDNDIYQMALLRTNDKKAQNKFIEYCQKMGNLTTADTAKINYENKYIKTFVDLEIMYSKKASLDIVLENVLNITPMELKRSNAEILKMKKSMDTNYGQDETFILFMISLPVFVREALISIHVADRDGKFSTSSQKEMTEAIRRSVANGDMKNVNEILIKLESLKALFSTFGTELSTESMEHFASAVKQSAQQQAGKPYAESTRLFSHGKMSPDKMQPPVNDKQFTNEPDPNKNKNAPDKTVK